MLTVDSFKCHDTSIMVYDVATTSEYGANVSVTNTSSGWVGAAQQSLVHFYDASLKVL
jgi:hypothetical protein